MKKTVFISSTYSDLIEERRVVWDLLEDFEVIIRGMEKFGARTEAPLDTCLAEVDLSDIYIGIISIRLGSIDVNTGKSFTQLEYERADEYNKYLLIYLVDEENVKIPPIYVDFGHEYVLKSKNPPPKDLSSTIVELEVRRSKRWKTLNKSAEHFSLKG